MPRLWTFPSNKFNCNSIRQIVAALCLTSALFFSAVPCRAQDERLKLSFPLQNDISKGENRKMIIPAEYIGKLALGDVLWIEDDDKNVPPESVTWKLPAEENPQYVVASFAYDHKKEQARAFFYWPPARPSRVIQTVQKGGNVSIVLDSVGGLVPGSRLRISDPQNATEEIITVRAISKDNKHKNTIEASLENNYPAGTHVEPYRVVGCSPQNGANTDRGIITVGCPKVWRSDRVFTVLDGILRDVDSITIKALQDLDANRSNATELIRLVNDLQIAVKADQGAAINSALARQAITAQRGADVTNFNNTQQSNEKVQKLRLDLVQQRVNLGKQESDLIAQGNTDATKDPFKSIKDKEDAIDAQIKGIDSGNLSQPALTIQDQKLSPDSTTSAPNVNPSTSDTLSDMAKTVLQQGLQSPSLPAAVQMDNVIELLHQRLSREFSVLYDDLSRQSKDYDIYLVQFDIGIVPRPGSKDREARVELRFEDPSILAYELYPGASSYNTLRGLDKTGRIGVSGAVQTVMGFGMNASFAHEKNQLRSGLSQSLFLSGFGAGRSDFGWEIGASPFDNFINPGTRIVHAIILVPKGHGGPGKRLPLRAEFSWPGRQPRYNYRGFLLHILQLPLYGLGMPLVNFPPSGIDEGRTNASTQIDLVLPDVPHMTINRISYSPLLLKETPGTQTTAAATEKPSPVQITFKEPVDPNLVVTVNDKLINRVRDVRGRALFNGTAETLAGNENEQTTLKKSRFGLLEADTLGPDTWVQLNSQSILLNLSRDTAGTDTFPTITLSDPGSGGAELVQLINQQRHATVRVGDWLFENAKVPESAFLPLYTLPYQPGRFTAFVEDVDDPNAAHPRPTRIRLISETRREGRSSPVWLHEQAQVVLVSKDDSHNKNDTVTNHWALDCDGEEGTLSCRVPVKDIADTQADRDADFPTRFKIWLDEPPYLERPGFWADQDIEGDSSGTWKRQIYYKGDWTEISEECLHVDPNGTERNVCQPEPWNRWHAELKVKNLLDTTGYAIKEFLTPIPHLQAAVSDLEDAKKKAKGPEATYLKQIIDETNEFLGSQKTVKNSKGHLETKIQPAREQDPVRMNVDTTKGILSLDIAFEAALILPETLHLVTCTKNVPKNIDSCDLANPVLTLPKLYTRLLPGPVKFADNDGSYQLEGERLRAVDNVRLESSGEPILIKPVVGYNDVNFFLPATEKKKIDDANTAAAAKAATAKAAAAKAGADAGKNTDEKPKTIAKKYTVFVMINGVTLPVYQVNNKKLEQVTFTYPKPDPTPKPNSSSAASPSPKPADTTDQSSVQLKMNIDMNTAANATVTKGAKTDTTAKRPPPAVKTPPPTQTPPPATQRPPTQTPPPAIKTPPPAQTPPPAAKTPPDTKTGGKNGKGGKTGKGKKAPPKSDSQEPPIDHS